MVSSFGLLASNALEVGLPDTEVELLFLLDLSGLAFLVSLSSFGQESKLINIFVDKNEGKSAYNFLNEVRSNPESFDAIFPFLKVSNISSEKLIWNETLALVAQRKAFDMADKNYFDHVDPFGYGINYYINKAGYKLISAFLKNKKDNNFESDHPYNHQVISSKGCITDDVVPDNSKLRKLYDSQLFRNFIAQTVNKKQLYEYADNLSSINIHYAAQSQELGWHFDNSSFAVTLLIQKSQKGGEFQYVRNFRDADNNDMNFSGVKKLLRGEINSESLSMEPGTLVLFRGKNSIHRVTPVEGDLTRILAVLAYNSEPNISLSETSRMTFYGRLN